MDELDVQVRPEGVADREEPDGPAAFSPAEVDGRPSPVRILYTYEFLWRPRVVETPVAAVEVANFAGALVERGTRNPLPAATVVVRTDDGDLEAAVDEKGRFELKGVPPGTWSVVVSSPDHVRYEVKETFRTGVRTEVTYYVRKQLYGFYETGAVWSYFDGGAPAASLSSAGGGIRVFMADDWTGGVGVAFPLTYKSPFNQDRDPRVLPPRDVVDAKTARVTPPPERRGRPSSRSSWAWS